MIAVTPRLAVLVTVAAAIFATNANGADQLGYFKGGDRSRVFVYRLAPDEDEQDARRVASRLMHTVGRITASYFFDPDVDVPGDVVTMAPDFGAVNSFLYESPRVPAWRYAYAHAVDGSEAFIDCRNGGRVPDGSLAASLVSCR